MKNRTGWSMVALSFIIYFICDGLTYSFGLIFVDILRYFRKSTSRTAMIASLINCVPLLYSPLSQYLISKFGFQRCTMFAGLAVSSSFCISFFITNFYLLQIVYGFVATLGFSIGYMVAYLILPCWFEKNVGFATGITVSGAGIGQTMFSFLINFLLEYYGWQGASLIIGGICLNVIVLGYLYRVPSELPISERHDPRLSPSTTKPNLNHHRVPCCAVIVNVLKVPKLWLFFAVNFLVMLSFGVPYVYLADYIRINRIRLSTSIPYALMGTSSAIGQITFGWFISKKYIPDFMLMSITNFAACASCLLIVFGPRSRAVCILHAMSYGVSVNVLYILLITLLIEALGTDNLNTGLALTQTVQGIGMLVGVPFSGYLRDLTGNYTWSYGFAACGFAVAASLALLWPFFKTKKGDKVTTHASLCCEPGSSLHLSVSDNNPSGQPATWFADGIGLQN